jgi:hypothetical protein
VGFRHLALAERKGAASIRRPAAVVVTNDDLGLAITESDAVAHHGCPPQTHLRLGEAKRTRVRAARFASRSFLKPKRKVGAQGSWSWRDGLEIATAPYRPVIGQQLDPDENQRNANHGREQRRLRELSYQSLSRLGLTFLLRGCRVVKSSRAI